MILGNVAITAGTGFGNLNDPNYNNVGLLLTGAAGTNGATNNTFLDSSPYGQTVTRNGDVTQGAFTPYLGTGYYGAYFDGSGDYLTASASSVMNLGTSTDFTVELWINMAAAIASGQYGAIMVAGTSNFMIELGFSSTSVSSINFSNFGSGGFGTNTGTLTVGRWHHLAVTRVGTTWRMFIDGVLRSYSASSSVNANWSGVNIAGSGIASNINCYISNVRVSLGTIYPTSETTNGNTVFTPPTVPLTNLPSTLLLTCQSNRFVDNGNNNLTLTRTGNVTVTHFNPFTWNGGPYTTTFNGGSMYFDGTGDTLTVPDSVNLQMGSGNFTIELWAYVTGGSSWRALLSKGAAATGWSIIISNTGVWAFSETVSNYLSSITVLNNTWYHLALVRSGTTMTLYVNGVSAVSATISTNYNQTDILYVGAGRAGDILFTGYISNVRIIKGTAVYTGAFTPPTQPLQPVYNTVLLLNGTNAGITDRSENTNLVTVADARLSTTQTRYNPTSIFFDGTGDALYSPWNPSLEFGAGNFTIEFWAYVAGGNSLFCWSADFHYGMTFNYGGATSNRVGVWASSNGSTWNIFNADGGGNGISTGTITLNTWTYVTLVRNGSTWTLYLNGTSAWTGTSSATIITRSTDTFRIGGPWPGAGPANLNGYIDDFRITPGVARYTANFTPPTYSPLGF